MSETQTYRTSETALTPSFTRTFQDPAAELASRRMLEAYFGPQGLINRPIPVPEKEIAGLSPLEIQARNLAGGLGGFGQQLAEAQEMYRAAGRGFDPASAGLFTDPRARQLYEQSMQAYDPSMGERFVDQRARQEMGRAIRDIDQAGATIPRITGDARRQIGLASDQAQIESAMGQQALREAAGQVGGVIGEGRQGLTSALSAAQRAAGVAETGITDAASGIVGQVGGAQTGAAEATERARRQVGMAGRDLRSAGRMGRSAAERGIAGLAGTGEAFDPSDINRFQDPFTQEVIDAQQAEIARLGEKQKSDARAQQVRAGAFGGSRGAIQEAEIGRNVLQQQAKTGAELRSQGFQQAAQQAQSAFEQAQARRQQAAQLTGSLGQAGAQTGISAAGQAGQLGLSAEQLAQRGALEGGQLGLAGQQGIGSLLGQAGEFGLRAADAERGIASERTALGMQGIQSEADLANRASQLGITTQQLRAELAQQGGALGLQGAQAQAGLAGQRADIASGLARDFQSGQQLGADIFGQQMGRTAGAAAGLGGLTRGAFGDALSAYQAGQQGARASAAGIAGLGAQGQDMLSRQIGTLGQLGGVGRGIDQAGLDARYTAATQLADEPYMRLQRGMQLLGQGSQFLPQFGTSVGTQQVGLGAYQQPGTAANIGSAITSGLQMYKNLGGTFGGGGGTGGGTTQ